MTSWTKPVGNANRPNSGIGTFRTWSDVGLESGMRSKADVKNRLRSDRRSGCRDLIQVIVAGGTSLTGSSSRFTSAEFSSDHKKAPGKQLDGWQKGAHSLLRQRHMPRIRAPMSMRVPWLAGLAAAPDIAIGQTDFSYRPRERSVIVLTLDVKTCRPP